MHDNLLECCDKRGDAWASEVQKRLCGCLDLVAAEACKLLFAAFT